MNDRTPLPVDRWQSEREAMVERQLSRRGIKDPVVLSAMRRVPRHEFVRPDDLARAYGDHPLEIGCEQTISQPYIVASMTEELHLGPDSRVLEIGTGCGYQTAVLAEIAKRVYTIEIIPELQREALARLHRLGWDNFDARAGDGSLGWPEEAPFDAILVAAAAPEVPAPLLEQLATPGRMVIPVGPATGNQQLLMIEKDRKGLRTSTLYAVRFVPLWTAESSDSNQATDG